MKKKGKNNKKKKCRTYGKYYKHSIKKTNDRISIIYLCILLYMLCLWLTEKKECHKKGKLGIDGEREMEKIYKLLPISHFELEFHSKANNPMNFVFSFPFSFSILFLILFLCVVIACINRFRWL